MSKIVKSYTLRNLKALRQQYQDSRFVYERSTIESFIVWLEDRESQAEQRTEQFFRRMS